MTDYRVLYYPDFSPDPTWLRKILLLSDGVLRIVPADVDLDDTNDLLRFQEAGWLTRVVPDDADTAIEPGDEHRLTQAFRMIRNKSKRGPASIQIEISTDGSLSILEHVFVHNAKLSSFVLQQLKGNGLVIESLGELAPSKEFIVVQKDASDIILSGLASRIARRVGVDAITDKPMPFAFGALRGIASHADHGAAEGALLSAVASVMIPASITKIGFQQYQEIRDSYSGIRDAFKALTSELARVHRLGRVDDGIEFSSRVETVACEFSQQYKEYRKSRFARRIRSWIPMSVGGVLSVAAAVVAPPIAAGIAVASVGIQVIEKCMDVPTDVARERVFHMLTGLRRDVIRRSGVRELV